MYDIKNCGYMEPFLRVFFDRAIFYSMAKLIDYRLAVILSGME